MSSTVHPVDEHLPSGKLAAQGQRPGLGACCRPPWSGESAGPAACVR